MLKNYQFFRKKYCNGIYWCVNIVLVQNSDVTNNAGAIIFGGLFWLRINQLQLNMQ